VWVASQIKVDAMVKFFSETLQVFEKLLPVPIADLMSPLGRAAFSFEEFGLIMVLGLWTVTRASDCVAGRLGAGTMEMLLAQPLRRVSLVTTHTLVTLVGVVAVAAAATIGLGLGLAFGKFEEPPALSQLTPAALNFLGLGLFITGAATFVSSLVRTRTTAVGAIIAFYVIELVLMIAARLSDQFRWMEWLTIFTAYEPTLLTLGVDREPATYWPLFWQYNAWLFGLGGLTLVLSAAIFSHRDVPAPL
jgi:ABC-2 type transport system permease protein